MSKFKVIATIEQIIEADNKQNAFKRAHSLIDIDGIVSFNTGNINYRIENYGEWLWVKKYMKICYGNR